MQGIIMLLPLSAVCAMRSGNFDRPTWSADGGNWFRSWARECRAWCNAASARMSATQQATEIQLTMRRVARGFAVHLPRQAIDFGAIIKGQPIDPVLYIISLLGQRSENLKDERSVNAGTYWSFGSCA